jgi:Type II secretion system (T2SS), protein E, N-terminal domain
MDLRLALIEENVASAEQVEEAVARQVLYGGDLITNLLDRWAVEEGRAQRALCRAYTLPAAPLGELPNATAEALQRLPLSEAVRYGLYPLRADGPVLTVAASEPPSRSVIFNLRTAHDVQLEVLLALDARVRQALARDGNSTMEPRAFKALTRLELQTGPSSRPPNPLLDAPSFSSLPQAPSIAPLPFPKLWADADTPTEAEFSAETSPGPRVAPPPVAPRPAQRADAQGRADARSGRPPQQSLFPRPGSLASLASSTSTLRSRRRGPYTTKDAGEDLQAARSAEEMLQIFFDFAAQYFDFSLVFTLHTNSGALRDLRGTPPQVAEHLGLPLQFSDYPALTAPSPDQAYRLAVLAELDPRIAAWTGQSGQQRAVLTWVRVRGRSVMLLIGGFSQAHVELTDIGDVLAFGPLLSQAFERAIVFRKSGGEPDGSYTPGPPRSERARHSVPPDGRRTEALVRAFTRNIRARKSTE